MPTTDIFPLTDVSLIFNITLKAYTMSLIDTSSMTDIPGLANNELFFHITPKTDINNKW